MLAFEPTLSSYKAHTETWTHPNFNLLPFGVSLETGLKTFFEHSGETNPCNSFLQHNENYLGTTTHTLKGDAVNEYYGKKKPGDKGWVAFRELRRGQASTKDAKPRLVPTIRLDDLISLTNRDIDFIKIDAQGYDYHVFLSTGKLKRKVKVVQVEVQDLPAGDNRVMYSGAVLKKEMIKKMEEHGFDLIGCGVNGSVKEVSDGLREQNCIFVNRGMQGAAKALHDIAKRRVDKSSDFFVAYNAFRTPHS